MKENYDLVCESCEAEFELYTVKVGNDGLIPEHCPYCGAACGPDDEDEEEPEDED